MTVGGCLCSQPFEMFSNWFFFSDLWEQWHTDGLSVGFVVIWGGTTQDHFQPVSTTIWDRNFHLAMCRVTSLQEREVKWFCQGHTVYSILFKFLSSKRQRTLVSWTIFGCQWFKKVWLNLQRLFHKKKHLLHSFACGNLLWTLLH